MKTKQYIAIFVVTILFGACEKTSELNGLGVSGVQKEYLSSKIDSVMVIRFTNLAPDLRTLKQIDVRNPNGLLWGTCNLVNGVGYTTLKRDSLELYALKQPGGYTLTPLNEIQIPQISMISLDDPKVSSFASILIQPSATIQMQADVLLSATKDSIKNVGTFTQSDNPAYFRFVTKSSDIDHPNFKVNNLVVTLISQNGGNKVLSYRNFDPKGDTIVIKGANYSLNDKLSLRVKYTVGSYSDEITSVQYTVSAWTFQNDLTARTLSESGNKFFNLNNGRGARASAEPTAPRVVFEGNNSLSLIGGNDTIVTAAKITGYTYSGRDVNVVKTKYNQSPTKSNTFTGISVNDMIAIRLDYKNIKGVQVYSWGVIRIDAIADSGTPDELITFSYQYKPASY